MAKALYASVKSEMMTIVDQMRRNREENQDDEILFTETRLVRQYNVSRTTVRKAVDELVQEGVLMRIPGKGVGACDGVTQLFPESQKNKKLVFILYFHQNDHVFSELFLGLSKSANDNGYSYNLYNLAESSIEQIMNQIDFDTVDGILLAYNSNDIPDRIIEKLLNTAIPLVFLDNLPQGIGPDGNGYISILSDDFTGGFLCACSLLIKSHRNVIYTIPVKPEYTQTKRLDGFLSAFQQIRSGNVHVLRHKANLEGELKEFLKDNPEYTAIACPSDGLVRRCYSVLDELGIRYPEDMSLVGYSDAFFSTSGEVPMSTVHQPFFEMGFAGGEMMIEHLEKETPLVSQMFDVEYVERASVSNAGASNAQ